MALSHESVISSRPIRFLVGLERKDFTIHSALIERYSIELHNTVNACKLDVKGDENPPVALEKVNVDVFVRFSEFAYSGNYTATEPEPVCDLGRAATDKGQLMEPANGIDRSPTKKRKTTKDRGELTKVKLFSDFKKRSYLDNGPRFEQTRVPTRAVYTEIFLCHAYVYVFKIKYGIDDLQKLALYKLHQNLVDCPQTKAHHVVPVIEYAFSNTVKRTGDDTRIDPLRELLTHFAASFIEFLVLSPEFRSLLEKGGDFPKDLIQNRLSTLG